MEISAQDSPAPEAADPADPQPSMATEPSRNAVVPAELAPVSSGVAEVPVAAEAIADDDEDGTGAALMDDDEPFAPPAADGFSALGLAPAIADTVAALGYETPTDVQSRCIPPLLAGRDLLGQAQTGTGKTAAFALPLLSRLLTQGEAGDPDAAPEGPRVLVLAPTRELALQVAEAFQRYGHHVPDFHVAPIYGGQAYSQQIRALRRVPHVVIGTPGRVMDHMRRGTLSLASLTAMVLDEADEMLAMGFAEDIDWIFDYAPEDTQVALFSATMPDTIRRVAQRHLKNPVEIRIAAASLTVDTIDQQHVVVTRNHKLDLLTRLLELEPVDGSVVFVRTRHATAELAERLKAHGFAAEALHGDMDQTLRERTIEGLRQGRLDVLVATDVAARGLDVERVTHVINFDIPTDPQAYVHRIGRTGRAGRAGRAILMVEPRERGLLRSIERTIGRGVPQMPPPSAAAVSASRVDRFTSELRETLAMQDLNFFYQLVANISKDQELDLMDIAAALAFQLQKDRPLEVTEELQLPQGRERRDGDGRPPRFGDRERGGERPRPERRFDRPQGPRDFNRADDRGAPRRPFERPESARSGYGDNRPPFERRERYPDGNRADGNRAEGYRSDRPQQNRQRPDGNRAERPDRQAGGGRHQGTGELTSYRIEVGRNHGVTPREIVGAIANEAELDGRYIGRIEISDNHSVVDLPAGMPREVFDHLKGVYVCGQPLAISHASAQDRPAPGAWRERRDGDSRPPRRDDGPRRSYAGGDDRRRPFGGDDRPRRSFEPGNGHPRDGGGFKRKRRD